MALELFLNSLEGVDETIAGMYRKDGDKFVLDLSTDQLKQHPSNAGLISALDREREDRRKAVEEATAIADKYKNIDPEKAAAALATVQELEDKQMVDAGKIDELVASKVERMRADFEAQIVAKDKALGEHSASNDLLTQELSDIKIYDAVKDSALGKGARPEAITDIRNRAEGVWQLRDGKPIALKGEDVVFGKNGEALSIDEWVDTLSTDAPYLFQPNQGGNSGGGDNSGSSFTGGVKILSQESAGDNLAAIASGEAIIQR
jgi:hypothetical protein